MGNSDWDNYLRDLLGDFKSEGETPHWDEFEQQLDSRSIPDDSADPLTDENLKETLSSYRTSDQVTGWERIEDSLNTADHEFDARVGQKIKHYEAPFDPHSWSLFLNQLSANKLLRVKLIALKTVESLALLLLLLTAFNISREGNFPFTNTPDAQEALPITHPQIQPDDKVFNDINAPGKNSPGLVSHIKNPITSSSPITPEVKSSDISSFESAGKFYPEMDQAVYLSLGAEAIMEPYLPSVNPAENFNTTFADISLTEVGYTDASEVTGSTNPIVIPSSENRTEGISDGNLKPLAINETYVTEAIALIPPATTTSIPNTIPAPKIVASKMSHYLEFGMLAQVDYNQLKMPEDRLFSFGRTFVFPLQGITSPGYGGGFTLAIGHPRWAVETGLIYSAKTFKPGRELTIGDEFDNGNVEFEAMRLQLVSVPFHMRYRFENKGRLKAYALAGFGLHVIVQSDIDIIAKYNFASLAAGENPNNVLELAQTIRETKRISEDFKDGAPFSTKSFISANLGLGLEYSLRENKALFLQTAYQYQIPNLRFSNHNGKHILSLSLQAGVRTTLGS